MSNLQELKEALKTPYNRIELLNLINEHSKEEFEIEEVWELAVETETQLASRVQSIIEYYESNKFNNFLADAMEKVTEELFNSIEPGEEKTLNKKYHLYRYLEDDIISIYETETEEEVIQVLTNGKGKFEFESLI